LKDPLFLTVRHDLKGLTMGEGPIDHEVKKEIEEIIKQISCDKGVRCYKSGFKNLCKARDIGLDSYLECLEENPQDCKFSLFFGYSHFCQCPLRIYLAKRIKE